jgi:hypothetical protein
MDRIACLGIPLEPEKPKDPEPDLTTKPENFVKYYFGFVCPKKHIQETFETIKVEDYKIRRACQTCGKVSQPAVIRAIAEPEWSKSGYSQFTYWTDQTRKPPCDKWVWLIPFNSYRYEFVHYLDTPKPRRRK